MNDEAVRAGIAAHVSNDRVSIFRVIVFMEYPEDGGTNPIRNIVNYTPVYMEK
jgi:hypothetical protein